MIDRKKPMHLALVPVEGRSPRKLRRPKKGFEAVILEPERLADLAKQMVDQAERLEVISRYAADACFEGKAIVARAMARQAATEARWGAGDLRNAASILDVVARMVAAENEAA